MTPEQEQSLKATSKQAMRKAREDIRNAVREVMVREGLTAENIMRAAIDMAREIVNNTLKERKLNQMVTDEVNKAMANALEEVRQHSPNKQSIIATIRAKVEEEAQKLAYQAVKENLRVDVGVKDNTHSYPHGATY